MQCGLLSEGRCYAAFEMTHLYLCLWCGVGAFNAFHYKAVAEILLYDTQYNDTNWTLSQGVVIALVELKFRGQALLYVPASVQNVIHRPYPRHRRISFDEAFRTCIEQVERDATTVYQNRSLFKEFKAKLTDPTSPYYAVRTFQLNVRIKGQNGR